MTPEAITRQNHYVPIWYQKRFILGTKKSLYFLDLDPPKTLLPDGRVIVRRDVGPRAPKSCFWAEDLYTTRFGNTLNDEVERYLFGSIDNDGANAVRALANNDLGTIHNLFQRFFVYLDAQKLRTPKGLDWIKSKYPTLTQLHLMLEMQQLRQMHCTMWYESVREIISAEQSDVKFIVTDHPVTVYNPACLPTSSACRYPDDPSIALKGTQTLFALDADHCLVLTNLEYAQNPTRVDLMTPRENARHYGQTIARTDAFIRTRTVARDDVVSINYLLKARARKYIAASEKDWLYPEKAIRGAWAAIGKILLPPADELWHFGGEVYVGYKDGSTYYQDAFGRTSDSHKYLQKKNRPTALGPNDLCGCGSGRKFKKCCKDVPEKERVSWSVYSIRERNILFSNAVMDILGLDKGKAWDDVRRELSDDQVKRIHIAFESLWPKDTNIAGLLPRPDKRVFRALYMGPIDPRTIAATAIGWLVYFDEIVVINPFTNASHMKPEFSPVHSPAQYKEQTLKNVMLLLTLAPFIHAGVIHMIPDPADFNADFRRMMWEVARERTANSTPSTKDVAPFRKLVEDDFERSTLRLPDDSLRSLIHRSSPKLTPEQVESTVRYMKQKQANDPLALLQPMSPGESNGQLQITRSVNLELALFLGQSTGSTIYTDVPILREHLHAHTDAVSGPRTASPWMLVSEIMQTIEFTLECNPELILQIRSSGDLGEVRHVLRRIWNAIRTQETTSNSKIAEQLAEELQRAGEQVSRGWLSSARTSTRSTRLQRRFEISIPAGGFGRNTVHRLLIIFGPPNHMTAIPMAMFFKEIDARQSIAK
jgi:hypothetical protein